MRRYQLPNLNLGVIIAIQEISWSGPRVREAEDPKQSRTMPLLLGKLMSGSEASTLPTAAVSGTVRVIAHVLVYHHPDHENHKTAASLGRVTSQPA